MLEIRHVVVPLDGSPQANAALPLVVALASPIHVGVLLVRVVSAQRDVPAAQRALEAVAREVRGNEIGATARVLVGDPAGQVPALLADSDLVVLGLRSRPDFGELTKALLGSDVPVALRCAGGRRVRRIARVGAEPFEPAAGFARDLAVRLGTPCLSVDPEDAEARSGVDLLVVARDHAGLALDPAVDLPLLVV